MFKGRGNDIKFFRDFLNSEIFAVNAHANFVQVYNTIILSDNQFKQLISFKLCQVRRFRSLVSGKPSIAKERQSEIECK